MRTQLRRSLAIVLVLVACAASAQKPPPGLEPLPEPPPPPSMPEGSIDEPRVQIPIQKEDKVEPIRQNGRVVAVKVTPPGGVTLSITTRPPTRTSST